MDSLQVWDVGFYVQLTLDPDTIPLTTTQREFSYCLIGKVVHLDTLTVVLNPVDVYRPEARYPCFENTPERYLKLLNEMEARREPNVLNLDTFRALKADADNPTTRADYMKGKLSHIFETATSQRVVSLDTIIAIDRLRTNI